MAKKKNPDKQKKSAIMTIDGLTLTLKPLSPFLMESVKNSVDVPRPPTYLATTAYGVVETHFLDENNATTQEEKELVYEYLMAKRRSEREMIDRVNNLVLTKGIEFEMPEDGEWIEEQEFIGLAIPEKPLQRRIHYLKTEVITDPEIFIEIANTIMRLTGVDEEILRSAQASFRSEMATAQGVEADSSE